MTHVVSLLPMVACMAMMFGVGTITRLATHARRRSRQR
jgi:hypothetical protein